METERLLLENPSFDAWWWMARAYHSLVVVLHRFFEERGVTGAQFGVLRCLSDAGDEGLMLSDLSERLLVTCGNVTGIVDRLEQAGYLRRERSREDRRVVIARLTPDGAAKFREILPAYLDLLESCGSELSVEERMAVARGCEALHRRAEQLRQSAPETEAAKETR